jgi:hypothetical protein
MTEFHSRASLQDRNRSGDPSNGRTTKDEVAPSGRCRSARARLSSLTGRPADTSLVVPNKLAYEDQGDLPRARSPSYMVASTSCFVAVVGTAS